MLNLKRDEENQWVVFFEDGEVIGAIKTKSPTSMALAFPFHVVIKREETLTETEKELFNEFVLNQL